MAVIRWPLYTIMRVVILDLSKGARLEFCRAGTGSRKRAQCKHRLLQVKEGVVKCP